MQSHPPLSMPGRRTSVLPSLAREAWGSLALLLAFAVALWLAMTHVMAPPAVVPAGAPATEFSAERALPHLRVIAKEPHTVGSPAQARVRTYILEQIRAMGLTPVVQQTTGAITDEAGLFASNLHNILVRIPGSASTGAVAVMAHYDSQPNTPGASDDGAAVAGILEAMRAIQAGPRPRNDLIFILTDAEEVDAQGADAFFWQHPWAREIRLVVNFEAAGTGGPSLLLQTGRGNRGVVEGFARGVPHPVAHSFLTQLLTVIPLGTDLSVFIDNGIPGLSPMFGWGYHTIYHSMLDNVDALDRRSLQHQGENALGLARAFGNQDLARLNSEEDAVFFSVWPGVVIRYPAGWAMPLAILAALVLAAVMAAGLRRRRLTAGGILAGAAFAGAGVLVPTALAALVWTGIVRLHPEFWRHLMGAPYRADVYLAGLVALVAAFSLTFFLLARRKVSAAHLTAGALLIWLALALLTAVPLPGMSYLFTWPALATTLPLALGILSPVAARESATGPHIWAWLAGLILSAAVIILVVVPVVVLLYLLVGFWFLTMQPGLPFIAVPLLLVALLLGMLGLQVELLTRRRPWLAPGIAGALAAGLLVAAGLTLGFDASQPMQNGVWYELDADRGEAAWYSYGERPEDPWTAQFFPGAIESVNLADVYAALPDAPVPPGGFTGPAPAAPLPAPRLTVLSDQVGEGVRMVQLHLASDRGARGLRVTVTGAPVRAAVVNGNRQTNPAWADQSAWHLRYYGLTVEGLDLTLGVEPSLPLTLVVADQSDGLPELPGVAYAPRDPGMMPFEIAQEYMPYPETALVARTFQLP